MGDEIVILTKNLISIPTVSGDIEQANKIIKLTKNQLNNFEPVSFQSDNFPSLLFSNSRKEIKKFKIMLNAHLDVVPAEQELFVPHEKDGKLYGRGAYDMKGAAAVMILLFKELAHNVSYPLGLQITTDEEVSGYNGTGYQIRQGVRTNFAIMGECNSNFQITNQAKGRTVVKITIKGDSAHSAHPWRGENAIWEMYKVLEPIMKAYPIPVEETFESTVSITKIEAENDATNIIPDNCVAYLDIRFTEKDKNTIMPKIRSLLPDDAVIDAKHRRPTHYSDSKNIYITSLRKITTDFIKKELPLRSAHATSDAPFFSSVGCDAVEFGPIGRSPHHENEWVDIQSLKDYYKILKQFLLSIK